MKKKALALGVFALSAALLLVGCNGAVTNDEDLPFNRKPDFSYVDSSSVNGKSLKVGAILIGDQNEGYSNAHIKGINKAKQVLEDAGATVEVSWEYNISDSDTAKVVSKINSLTAAQNDIVIVNSYGHQNAFAANQFDCSTQPQIDYISMTGDQAHIMGWSNYHNAFCDTYQARFMAGYVAGLKLKEAETKGLIKENNKDENGRVKVGYVGAFTYAEVISGYTAFYLGINEGFGKQVAMSVKFVGSWWDHDAEKAAANDLIASGCMVISQHADSTGTPEACQDAWRSGKTVYNVGYNVSMIEAAEDCSLTSATNNWAVFYTQAFYKKLRGEQIATNWCDGYNAGANGITGINYKCFDESGDSLDEKLTAMSNKIANGGSKYVFDCSRFTANGEHLTSYTITDDFSTVKGAQVIKQDGSNYFFDESNEQEVRSAPYFDIRIDGITLVNEIY